PAKEKFIVAGLAVDPRGKRLAVAGPWAGAVVLVPIDAPEKAVRIGVGTGSFPYACQFAADGKRLFVSLWGRASVAEIDLETNQMERASLVEPHPTEMALSPDGKLLYVACANSTKVSVLDTADRKAVQTIACSLYPSVPKGNTPNSLCLTPDGK